MIPFKDKNKQLQHVEKSNSSNTNKTSNGNRQLSESELIHITVTENSTDMDIDKMSLANMCSELLRLSPLADPPLTMEQINKKTGHTVSTELKLKRDDLKRANIDEKTQFILSASTNDNAISLLNHDQALFAIRQFALEKRVIPDEAFLTKMDINQLQREVRQIRDVIKKGAKEIQSQSESVRMMV